MRKQIRRLTETDHGLSGDVARALNAHHELIRVLSERLDGLQREQTRHLSRTAENSLKESIGEREKNDVTA
jgi:hypothetical protein